MQNEIATYLATLSTEARADIAAGNWDEVMADALYIAVGATTRDEMSHARRVAEDICAAK